MLESLGKRVARYLHAQFGGYQPVNNPVYTLLIDDATNAVLTLSPRASIMVFLSECMHDTLYVANANYPNYRGSFYLDSIPSTDYPRWTWDRKKRKLIKTKPGVLTDQLFARARLAKSKRDVIGQIIGGINEARYKVSTGLILQETVYMTKKYQAKAFIDSGYDEELILEYPYVEQYAGFARIPLKEAADEIFFQAKLDDQRLANTELLRLKYFNKVREATAPEQLPAILKAFLNDCFFLV